MTINAFNPSYQLRKNNTIHKTDKNLSFGSKDYKPPIGLRFPTHTDSDISSCIDTTELLNVIMLELGPQKREEIADFVYNPKNKKYPDNILDSLKEGVEVKFSEKIYFKIFERKFKNEIIKTKKYVANLNLSEAQLNERKEKFIKTWSERAAMVSLLKVKQELHNLKNMLEKTS